MFKILEQIIYSFDKYSNNIAYQIEDTVFTYSDFKNRISAISRLLTSDQMKDQFLIGIDSSEIDSFETYSQIFACVFSGKCFVPINLTYPKDRIEYLVKITGIKTILINQQTPKSISSHFNSLNVKFLDTSEISKGNRIELLNFPDDSYAYLLFTSGSTGTPKGVPLTRANLFGFVENFISLGYEIKPEDKFLQMFDFTFDLSIFSYFIPALFGASVHPISSKGIKLSNTFNTMLDNKVTIALVVPSILSFLKPYYDEIEVPYLRYLFFCGEALSNDLVNQFSKCAPNARIVNFYGPTEATIFCIYYEWENGLKERKHYNGTVSIGTAFQNMYGIILNDKNELTETKEIGELCLAGNQLTPSYFKNEEKNNEVFLQLQHQGELLRSYRTGDLAFYDEDGDIMFCGRKDFQVKIQGFRVELGEIEFNLRKILTNDDIVVIAITNPNSTIELHTFVKGIFPDTKEVKAKLSELLPQYMIPTNYHSIDHFPLNSNGKIDRNKLKQLI